MLMMTQRVLRSKLNEQLGRCARRVKGCSMPSPPPPPHHHHHHHTTIIITTPKYGDILLENNFPVKMSVLRVAAAAEGERGNAEAIMLCNRCLRNTNTYTKVCLVQKIQIHGSVHLKRGMQAMPQKSYITKGARSNAVMQHRIYSSKAGRKYRANVLSERCDDINIDNRILKELF